MELILMYSVIALAVFVIILVVVTVKLYTRLNHLSRGEKAASLEHIISENNRLLLEHTKHIEKQRHHIKELDTGIQDSFQNIGVIRFNPYKDTGGNQSFAIALLNNNNDGFVLSSLYTRERVNIFAKPIVKGVSEFTLTDEENQALQKAQL